MNRLVLVVALACAAMVVSAPAYAAEPLPPSLTFDPGFNVAGSGTRTVTGKAARLPGGAQPMQAEGGGGGICWGAQTLRSKGIWPANRGVWMYTVWCGSGGRITYRSSSVWPTLDPLCWCENGPHVAKISGGAGWTWVEVQAWGGFACHTPWWWDNHDVLLQRIAYYPNGHYAATYYQ